jgi:hypothetical protein
MRIAQAISQRIYKGDKLQKHDNGQQVHENQNNLSERICPHCGALMKEHSHSHF